MSKKKLTLSVDERLSKRAKTLARERGTSVSRLVETFFSALELPASEETSSKAPDEDPDEAELLEDTPLSEWARRWRGAFAAENTSDPDEPAWEEQVLAQEIAKKHK